MDFRVGWDIEHLTVLIINGSVLLKVEVNHILSTLSSGTHFQHVYLNLDMSCKLCVASFLRSSNFDQTYAKSVFVLSLFHSWSLFGFLIPPHCTTLSHSFTPCSLVYIYKVVWSGWAGTMLQQVGRKAGRLQHRGGICWLHIPLVSYTPLTTAKSDQSKRSVRSRPMRALRQLAAAHGGICRPIPSRTHGCTVQHLALVNITCRLSNYTADGF